MEKVSNINFNELIDYIMCKLVKEGYNKISLSLEDIEIYVPYILKMLNDNDIKYDHDIFCKTPVNETYDRFKSYMINYLNINRLGTMLQTNQFLLDIPNYAAEYYLLESKEYSDVIEQGYLIFSKQIDFEDNKKLQLIKKVVSN